MSCLGAELVQVNREVRGTFTFQAVTDLFKYVFLMRKGLFKLLNLLLFLVHLGGVVFNGVESLSSVVFILALYQYQLLLQVLP